MLPEGNLLLLYHLTGVVYGAAEVEDPGGQVESARFAGIVCLRRAPGRVLLRQSLPQDGASPRPVKGMRDDGIGC